MMRPKVRLSLAIDDRKHETLVPRDFLAVHLQIMCRARKLLNHKKACFIFHEKSGLLFSNMTVGEFFDKHAEDDVLELQVREENTFGNDTHEP